MADIHPAAHALPVQGKGPVGTAWWGMICLIATEALLFAFLIFSFLYLGSQTAADWPPGGPPALRLALPNTILLILSSIVVQWASKGIARRERGRWIGGLIATILMGALFIAVQLREWSNKTFSFTDDSYSSAYFTLTGIHLAHVAAGLIALLALLAWSVGGHLTRERHESASLVILYWHFVDLVWVTVFTVIYLVPRLS